jgi:hypothetical protein
MKHQAPTSNIQRSTKRQSMERGVHAASTSKMQSGSWLVVPPDSGRGSGLKPALQHAIAQDSTILSLRTSAFSAPLRFSGSMFEVSLELEAWKLELFP